MARLLLLLVSFMDCPFANSFHHLGLCHFDIGEVGHCSSAYRHQNNIIVGTGRRIICGISRGIRRRVSRLRGAFVEMNSFALDSTVTMLNNIGTAERGWK
jgi:hypothetical protein